MMKCKHHCKRLEYLRSMSRRTHIVQILILQEDTHDYYY